MEAPFRLTHNFSTMIMMMVQVLTTSIHMMVMASVYQILMPASKISWLLPKARPGGFAPNSSIMPNEPRGSTLGNLKITSGEDLTLSWHRPRRMKRMRAW